jgi:hypothetical protein
MNGPLDNELLPCRCCGFNTITAYGDYEICEVCGWEDDPIQGAEPDYAGGANKLSLNEFRKIWIVKKMTSQ